MRKITEGQRFGNLVAIKEVAKIGYKKKRRFLFKCDCGSAVETRLYAVTSGAQVDCGCRVDTKRCYKTERHGQSRERLYRIWKRMKARCFNPNVDEYKNYGGRGIVVCDKWLKYSGFLEDMNEGYGESLTIERIDNGKGYYKENCKWATQKEQANNTRTNVVIQYRGDRKTLAQWCEDLGLTYGTIKRRLHRGCEPRLAFERPIGRYL